MNIYVTGLIGYETARKLYEENKALIDARFPKFFLREFEKLSLLCIEKNTKKPYSRKNFYFDGVTYVREIKEGGIFAALWAACEDLGNKGCEVKLEDIPVDQHIVEILELLKENPYEVSSEGSYLVIADVDLPAENQLQDAWNADHEKISFVKIGTTTDSKDRVIISGENRRFLTPPSRQAQDIADRKDHQNN